MKRLKSIFGSLDECYFTKSVMVERHHIFGAYNRNRSEKLGFVVALSPFLHPNGSCVDDNMIRKHTAFKDKWELDKWLKQECQRRYEKNHAREEWMKEFGQSWL